MKDLASAFWIKLKGLLFLVIGITASVLIYLDNPKWQTAVFLALAVWSFCRFYYFAFYVIEKYVDRDTNFPACLRLPGTFASERKINSEVSWEQAMEIGVADINISRTRRH